MKMHLWYSQKQASIIERSSVNREFASAAPPFRTPICVSLIDGSAYAYTSISDENYKGAPNFDDVKAVVSYDDEESTAVLLVSQFGLTPEGREYARQKGLPETTGDVQASTVNLVFPLKLLLDKELVLEAVKRTGSEATTPKPPQP
ncbi:MAG: hypothetical protein FJX06_02785 [Alphaproteobacteria bacterium]|jgi:hypothetical protein|nr:hypothetical protein [Alphaproteobacteria bacterium]